LPYVFFKIVHNQLISFQTCNYFIRCPSQFIPTIYRSAQVVGYFPDSAVQLHSLLLPAHTFGKNTTFSELADKSRKEIDG
jgi:hypothetical protein